MKKQTKATGDSGADRPRASRRKRKEITILLDRADSWAVRMAVRYRLRHAMPSGESNQAGAAIAEICRGWLDMLGKWPWTGDPQVDGPKREAKPVTALKIVIDGGQTACRWRK